MIEEKYLDRFAQGGGIRRRREGSELGARIGGRHNNFFGSELEIRGRSGAHFSDYRSWPNDVPVGQDETCSRDGADTSFRLDRNTFDA